MGNAVAQYEIGVVYRKNGRHFLAVGGRTLISFDGDGNKQEVRPTGSRYEAVRTISVEDLCRGWGITLTDLDEVTTSYLAPPIETLKTRPRGSRRTRVADEFAWRSLRMIRVATAG